MTRRLGESEGGSGELTGLSDGWPISGRSFISGPAYCNGWSFVSTKSDDDGGGGTYFGEDVL